MKLYSLSLSFLVMCIMSWSFAQTFDGYALYNLQNQNITYLIDKDGNIAHSWSCSLPCNYSVKLNDDGNIVRGGVYTSNQLNGAAIGGIIQEIDPSGSIVWEYIYSNADHCSHHDFTLMPNGNVILIAWEVKSTTELTQAGASDASAEKWPTHFIELEPDGNGSATIVWEWHIWDHLIQDYDATKDNYGVVADHPELMDINAISGGGGPGGPPGGMGGDWFHINGIDYNADLDQLVFSSRFANEFYIIDHSTTAAEAASHTGGNSGMGGDFLYRWGNPSNYGSTATQTIAAAVHDPRWIPNDGRPNGGFIQFFNNEGGTGGSSVVDAIDAPDNGFTYTYSGNYYGPANYDWRHECLISSTGQSSSARMSNGNTFVNVSGGYMYEVDENDNVVWQYNAGPTKAFRYECDHPGVIALLGENPCGTLEVSEEIMSNVNWYPNPSTSGNFNLEGLANGDNPLSVSVVNVLGEVVLQSTFTNEIDLSSCDRGVYFVTLLFDGQKQVVRKVSYLK